MPKCVKICGPTSSQPDTIINRLLPRQKNGSEVAWDLPGGGPQGCTFGLIEYKSNSNDNANHIPGNMQFKFVDDL